MRRALAGGVAFHHGDLNREERVAVERGFRDAGGGVHVLVATSTVAAGVNTPASTVIVVETDFPGAEERQPYTVAQFKNMAGRAGRLGYETEGKAIALADTSFERESLFRRYVQGNPEAIRSSFDPRNPGTWMVRLLAQVKNVRRDAVIDLVANTYGGYLATLRDPTWRQSMIDRLERLLDRMLSDGLIEHIDDGLRLTMLGRACGESPLALDSMMQLIELLRRLCPEETKLETLLVLVEALPERDTDYTPQDRRGESKWQQEAAHRFGFDIGRTLRHRASSDREYYARCKRALIVSDWINGVATSEIEDRYSANAFVRVGHGDIRGYADGSRFLLESVLRITTIVLQKGADAEHTSILLKRLDIGIPADALGLTTIPFVLTRGEILGLWHANLTTHEAVAGASLPELHRLVGRRAEALYLALHPIPAAADKPL